MNTPQQPVHQGGAVHDVALPPPNYPMLTRMISGPLFPDDTSRGRDLARRLRDGARGEAAIADVVAYLETLGDKGKEEPVTWVVSQAHPLVPEMRVVRMFLDRGGVEVYSVSNDNKAGMRNLVPLSCVRLVEEFMPLDVFIEELADAEQLGDEIEPEDPAAPAAASNGQAAAAS